MFRFSATLMLLAGASCCVGCEGHPAAPTPPELSPQQSSQQAVDLYDTNGDQQLAKEEYEASPGLAAAATRIDTDGDGYLTAEEIATRIEYWLNSGTTIMSGNTRVTYRGSPLEGAEITYVPESFLGPAFKPSSGTTDTHGVARMQGQDAEFPGVYVGLYRVEVSKMANGKETIPAKYNEETELGVEISDDIYFETGMPQFDL